MIAKNVRIYCKQYKNGHKHGDSFGIVKGNSVSLARLNVTNL